ncbi:MAG TPA: hypothetical protein DEB35_10025 [Desulfuromonas sp.]|nr:hypothetical protein [Desulfuromonas sp.]
MNEFKILKPIAVTDATLTASNIAETDQPDYAPGSTYALAARVQVKDDGIHKVYESMIVDNSGKYPPDNLYDDSIDPPTGAWKEISATNKWKMFDGKSRAASTRAGDIVVSITPGESVGALALLNLECATLNITMTDPTDGEVFSRDVDLADLTEIDGWYSWFFAPLLNKPNAVITDLPRYPAATITITATAIDGTATVGECIMGNLKTIGTLLNGTTFAIEDWSDKTEDAEGNPVIEQGDYTDLLDFSVVIDTFRVYDIRRTLAFYRATPLVYIGNEAYTETIVYGSLERFTTVINNGTYAECSLEIKELS